MALIHPQSCACVKSELDLFSVPPTQSSVDHGQWVEYHPVAALGNGMSVEFAISGSGDDYMDLANTYLQVQAKIVNADGSNLSRDAEVAPVNLWLHSLFSQVDMSLNEKLVTPSSNTYPYRAYLETLLSYGTEAKNTQFSTSLFYKDTPGEMNTTAARNTGYTQRKMRVGESKIVDMLGRLHLDMFCQERYLINGVDLRLRLVRSADAFALMANLDGGFRPKIVLTSVTLFLRKIKLSPTVQLAHIKALEKSPVKYPIRRVESKVFSIPRGNLDVNQENLILGQLPKRIILGCVYNSAFNGHYTQNPFFFRHLDLNFLALYIDGQQVPGKPLQPNFDSRSYTRCYSSLFTSTGQFYQDEGNALTWDDYPRGYTLYAFDLTPDLAQGGAYFNLVKSGNVRLEMRFNTALPETVNVVVYCEFENIMQIDRARNVLFDYSA